MAEKKQKSHVLSLRVSPEQKDMIESFAELHGLSASTFIKSRVLDLIEEWQDFSVGMEALAQWEHEGSKVIKPEKVFEEINKESKGKEDLEEIA